MTVYITKPEVNIAEKLAKLDRPTGVAGQAMLRAKTAQEQFNLIGAGRRNLLINGDFQVSQRGDFTTASSAVNGEFFLDRWYTDVGSVAFTKQHTTGIDLMDLPIISKGVRLTATASGESYMGIRQKIENPTQYVGRTFTYSGYVKSNNPNARLTCFIAGTTNQYVISDTHSGNGEWEKLSITFTMSGNPTIAWYVDAFIVGNNFGTARIINGDYIEVTALQLETGRVSTPFEQRSYVEELSLCKRYFQTYGGEDTNQYIGTGQAWSNNTFNGVTIHLPVELRTKDFTFTYSDLLHWKIQNATGSGQSLASLTISSAENSAKIVSIRGTASGTPLVAGDAALLYAASLNARLNLLAEV